MTFSYLCKASNTMTVRVKVMAWNDNQRLYFISFQNTCVNLLYLSSTYLGSGGQGHVFKSQCQWARYDWVLETTSGIAHTWRKSFLKQMIIKATVLTWQLKMNFKLCSFSQTLWRLNLINISYRFAYWWSNVHGLESHWKIVFTYKVTTFDAEGAQLTSKLFS